VMHDGFSGEDWFSKPSEKKWEFTPAQITQLNKLCGR
jgi:hypothetical protein